MTRLFGLGVLGAMWLTTAPALAQTPAPAKPATQTPASSTDDTSISTTTINGDTGLWFVPTANVVDARKFSFSFYRIGTNDGQGFSNIVNVPFNVAYGIGGRVELFGGWDIVTRIDRDARPLFFTSANLANTTGGGVLENYPFVTNAWTGNQRGDSWVGAKARILDQSASHGVSLAARAYMKLPTGSKAGGVSTGRPDVTGDLVVSHDNKHVDISAYGGYLIRSKVPNYSMTNSWRWGVGGGFQAGGHVKITTELFGERYQNNVLTVPAGLFGADGSAVPTSSTLKNPVDFALGLTWANQSGFFVGAGVDFSLSMAGRSSATILNCPSCAFTDVASDRQDLQIRIGYHPGGAGGMGGADAITLEAFCDPSFVKNGTCEIEVNKTLMVHSTATDARKHPLTYAWTASAGSLAQPTAPETAWTAPSQPGAVTVTVAVDDAHKHGAQRGVPIMVVAVPVPPAVNHPPTVRASCDPCTIEVGKTATVAADAQDPDGDALTYQWGAPSGSLTSPTARQTPWTAPMQEGPVTLTVTVNDGKGGTASATTTIQVVRPPKKEYVFEDVHFDFDRYTLRQDALRVLDEAITAMQSDPTLRLEIEGHTCNIGTTEYNQALGERRANAVRDYLTSRGVGADRLHTVSYGEENPKFDNSREETRRLNRRAALVVKLQGGQ